MSYEAEPFDAAHGKPPQKAGNFWKHLSLFLMVVVVGGGFLMFSSGSSGGLGTTVALIRDTFGDVLGSGNEGKLSAEIELGSAREESGMSEGFSVADHSTTGNVGAAEMPGSDAGGSMAISNDPLPEEEVSSAASMTPGASPPPSNAASAFVTAVECTFQTGNASTYAALFNEIAWMGSPAQSGATASAASNNEWIELKNTSNVARDLSGAQIVSRSEKFRIALGSDARIPAHGFFMLERTDDDSAPGEADAIYTGALANAGDWLRLFDTNCNLLDEIDASGGWQGGNNETKATLERDVSGPAPPEGADAGGWHTSTIAGGTPGKENTTIASNPPASAGSPAPTPPPSSPTPSPEPPPPPPAAGPGHVVIAVVQIAGATAPNDFIKIFNPTPLAIDVSGWKLRKRASTGTESSIRVLPAGSAILAVGYFTWANSENGFSDSIAADTASTAELAANNSVALQDSSGATIDAVAWGTGTGQFVESAAYPENPTANQVLTRKTFGGVMQDTDNNAADFVIQ